MERRDHALAAFFVDDGGIEVGATIQLGEEVAHHARVRRLGPGERVALLDGAGRRAEGTIVRVARAAVSVSVEELSEIAPPPDVHLVVPVADRERMLWLAEKCTELGATSWRPLLWRRSRSVSPRGEGPAFAARLRARMVSALTQSGGGWLPAIHPDTTLDRAIAAAPGGVRLLLDPAGSPLLAERLSAPLTIATGPEGGVEEDEREHLESAGFRRVALAGNILRFETAAVAALAIARAALGAAPENLRGR